MGRYYWSKKEEADSLKKIEIWWLKKEGFLKGWRSSTMKWSRNGEERGSIGIEVSLVGDLRKYYRGEPSGEPDMRLNYTQTDRTTGEKKDFDYKIPLTTTPCSYGGVRYWFICPLSIDGIYCGRRVGVLYKSGDYFACRHCYNLTYNSRNLGGISKMVGQMISDPELDRLKSEVKRKYYAGKMTKKYRGYLKKQDKSMYQLRVMVRTLGYNR